MCISCTTRNRRQATDDSRARVRDSSGVADKPSLKRVLDVQDGDVHMAGNKPKHDA